MVCEAGTAGCVSGIALDAPIMFATIVPTVECKDRDKLCPIEVDKLCNEVDKLCDDFVAIKYLQGNQVDAKEWIDNFCNDRRGYWIVIDHYNQLPGLWKALTSDWPAIGKKITDRIHVELCGDETQTDDNLSTAISGIEQIIETERCLVLDDLRNIAHIATMKSVSQSIIKESPPLKLLGHTEADLMYRILVYHNFASKRVIENIIKIKTLDKDLDGADRWPFGVVGGC